MIILKSCLVILIMTRKIYLCKPLHLERLIFFHNLSKDLTDGKKAFSTFFRERQQTYDCLSLWFSSLHFRLMAFCYPYFLNLLGGNKLKSKFNVICFGANKKREKQLYYLCFY